MMEGEEKGAEGWDRDIVHRIGAHVGFWGGNKNERNLGGKSGRNDSRKGGGTRMKTSGALAMSFFFRSRVGSLSRKRRGNGKSGIRNNASQHSGKKERKQQCGVREVVKVRIFKGAGEKHKVGHARLSGENGLRKEPIEEEISFREEGSYRTQHEEKNGKPGLYL